MKLSDLDPSEVKVISTPEPSGMKLSQLKPEDISSASPDEISLPTALTSKFAEGATVGTLPILSGLANAASYGAGMLTTPDTVKSTNPEVQAKIESETPSAIQQLLDAYRQGRGETKQTLQQAGEQYPIASTAAELGGGFMTGGALAPASEAATTGQALLQGAKTGALAGGIAGFGSGNADLTKGEIGQAALETAKGSGLGAAGGTLAAGAVEGLGGLKNLVKNKAGQYKLGKQAARAYELGEQGQGISSDADIEKTTRAINTQAQKLTKFLSDQAEENWQSKLDVLKKSGKQFNLQDIEDLANQTIDETVSRGQLLPDQEQTVRQTLRNILYKKLPNEVKDAVNSVTKTTKQITRQTPEGLETTQKMTFSGKMSPEELQQASEELTPEQFQSLQSQMSVGPKQSSVTHKEGIIPEVTPTQQLGEVSPEEAAQSVRNIGNVAYDMTKPQVAPVLQRIAGKASGAFKEQFPEATPFTNKLSTLKNITDQLGETENIKALDIQQSSPKTLSFIENMTNIKDPEVVRQRDNIFQMLNKVDPEFASTFKKEAEQAALDKELVGAAQKQGISGAQGIIGGAKALGLKGINVAGQTVKKISDMTSWPQAKIQQMSSKLLQDTNPKSQALGNMLQSAIKTEPEKRPAMIFAISQNKDYRDMINNMLPGMEEEQK